LKLLDLGKKVFNGLEEPNSTPKLSIYDMEIHKLDGTPLLMDELRRKFILFVNVASKCGFTPQYRALEKLFRAYEEHLMIVGVPCNQFGGQEPGTASEIQTFCQRNYGVSFIITEKVDVKGNKQHPLYQWLTQKALNGKQSSTVRWNFQKYLVGPEGELIDFYYSTTSPMSKKIIRHLS